MADPAAPPLDIFAQMEADSAQFQRAPTDSESSALTKMGLELVEIDRRLEKYKEVAKALLKRKIELQMREMVDAMDAIGQDRIGFGDQGVDLILDDYYKASLPNADEGDEDYEEKMELRAKGIAWLSEHAEGLLNTQVVVTMPKGSLERAKEIVAMLTSEQGFGLAPSQVSLVEGVHWATLTSFVKEQVREKKATLPLDILGATVGRIVKIVKRKKSK